MSETSEKPTGFWTLLTAREVVMAALFMLPTLVGYIKLQGDVNAIKESFVSRDQLQIEVQKSLGSADVQLERINELTSQLKDNNEQLQQLMMELKAMRLEWSNYRGHR